MRGEGNTESTGAPIQEEVKALQAHIEAQSPPHHLQLVRKIDVLRQLKRREELPQADKDGFFFLASEEIPHVKEKYG